MISIVTPSFKQIEWLRLAIASVADQQDVVIEHIVQDAGTPDIDNALRHNLSKQTNEYQLRLFVEKDDGMYDAVNRGLKKSTGQICAYLNCDEQYLPGSLKIVEQFFAFNPGIDVLFSDVVLVNEAGVPVSYRRVVIPTRRHIRASHLNTLSCAMFFRRTIIERGLLFDPKLKDVGDAVWVDTLLRNNVRMQTLRQPLSVFAFTGVNRSIGAGAAQEKYARSPYKGLIGVAKRTSVIIEHRFAKLLAGAYARRDVPVEIYTLDSPAKRQLRHARVGYKWPSSAS